MALTSSTRRYMLRNGYFAVRYLATDPNGGTPLVPSWRIVTPESRFPHSGDDYRHRTRTEAWRAAEDHFEQKLTENRLAPGGVLA